MAKSSKTLLAALLGASALFAQFDAPVHPLAHNNNNAKEQNRSLTSTLNYTSLEAGIFAGILEQQDALFSLDMGLRTQKLMTENDSAGTFDAALFLPRLTVGTPERVAFRAFYGVTPLKSTDKDDELTLKLPLHQFGLAFASQMEEKLFRFSIDANAFIGNSAYEETSDSGRAVLGVENVGLSFGSTPHENFSFDLGVYASGFVDTLFGTTAVGGKQLTQERIAEVVLPQPILAMNFGTEEFPVQSTFGWSWARKHNVYAYRIPPSLTTVNDSAIVTDSIGWFLKNRGNIPVVENKLTVHPAVEFGYWHNRHKMMKPGDDNHPMRYGDEKEGHRWETSSFRFGFGLDLMILNSINYWAEYAHSNLKLDITGDILEIDQGADSHKEGFNRFTTGAEVGIHKIPGLNYPENGSLFFDLSFLTLQESMIYNSYYGSKQYEHLTDIDIDRGTQKWRYEPLEQAQMRVKTNDFSMGLRAGFMNNSFDIATRVHFLNQTHTDEDGDETLYKGPKFKLMFTYNLVENR